MSTNKDEAHLTDLELNILRKAVDKLNFVYTFGKGDSLTSEETMVFNYWKEKGKVRAVGPARFGEIYEIVGKKGDNTSSSLS